MIGVFQSLAGISASQPVVQRFASSLGVGLGQIAASFVANGTLLASTGQQARGWVPPRTREGAFVLFTGKIDNYAAIDAELGRKFSSDAHRYAAAYDAWGDKADLRLIGEFSTIMANPDRHWMRLCRSPIQAPPLHFHRDGVKAIAASTPRAIFATGEVEQEVDDLKIADSMLLNYREGERSWFKGISRVQTGERVVLGSDGLQRSTFYDINDVPEIRLKSDSDYVEAANALFAEGVSAALDGFSRPAISLSGGYDSQAVAAFAMAQRPSSQLFSFTSVPESGWEGEAPRGRFANERPHVEALAAMYPQLVTEWVDAAGLSFDHHLQNMFLLGGISPRNAMNLHWIHEVRARAKAKGCDVMLTGAMGNATISFSGEGMLADLFRQGRVLKVAKEAWLGRGSRSFARSFVSGAIMPNLPKPLWQAISRLVHDREQDVFETWCPMNRDWAREHRVEERALEMGHDQHYQAAGSTRQWRASIMRGAITEAGDVHMAFELLHGIPARDPTAYRPFFEFCLGIPDDQYFRHGERRWLARRMLKGKIPDMVLDEQRRGLQAADWHQRLYRQKDSLLQEIDRLALDGEMAARLDLASLRKTVASMTEVPPADPTTVRRLQLAVPRGLATARFIRYVQGRNDG